MPEMTDSRWTESGHIIMSKDQIYYPPMKKGNHTQQGYACQPYCFVYPDDGEWSCVMTWNNDSWIEGARFCPVFIASCCCFYRVFSPLSVVFWSSFSLLSDRVLDTGEPGEHMISTRTKDNGETWSEFIGQFFAQFFAQLSLMFAQLSSRVFAHVCAILDSYRAVRGR